jgi:dTDP-4-amino-4,6-dideoxygalactose transaminase|tara:strand:- start:836 stop:1978 length:1143 start_codon:yes stop_codon:yes gene_type:complete
LISFNKPPLTGNEEKYVLQAMHNDKISGNGFFGNKCETWFEKKIGCPKALLTPSCTAALEMAALLIDIKTNDEVIMPSYTFASTANAFVMRGAKIIFIDIRPDTMNIDETKIEQAITSKTKVIVPMHYAGVSCEMDHIMDIANRHNLYVVEDAAQCVMSKYKDKPLGTIGHLGTYSFHETKNYTSAGEGGLLIINDKKFKNQAEIIREKGTNRNQFFRGMVDKYTWVDLGSNYLMNELNAAYLWANLEKANEINKFRLDIWQKYYSELKQLEHNKMIELPTIPNGCTHNAHMFYLKVKDKENRNKLIKHLKQNDISSVFHYIPLHSSPAGKKFGKLNFEDTFTTIESERLMRLPMYYGLESANVSRVVNTIHDFYSGGNK